MPSVKLLDPVSDSSFCLSYFEPVSVQFVKRLISKMSSKSSALDPMPTKLLKKCLQQVVPVITRIINSSLESGKFPDSCKSAIVRPLLKKQGLDINILRNYRPISNLPYIAKLIEKTVLVQVNSYLCQNNLYAKCQSAYRVGHSTETALLRVQNDVLRALDIQNDVIIVLLDLSSAFDTIDHDILLHRLRCRFKIDGVVLEWIRSYLRGRTQRVCVGSVVSEAQFLDCGVPQGSVLGPVLFSLYTALDITFASQFSLKIASVLSLLARALLMEDSRLRMWSFVLRPFRKPLWWCVIRLFVSRYQRSREFIIRSISSYIGLYDKGLEESFPGLRRGIRIASFHCLGNLRCAKSY